MDGRDTNVPWTDQRSHTTLVDERYIEYLSRLPPGLQSPFAAVLSVVEEAKREAERLERLDERVRRIERGEAVDQDDDQDDAGLEIQLTPRGDVRILKGTTTYTDPQGERQTRRIWSVIQRRHITYYKNKARHQAAELQNWVYRMYRLLIGESGKGRQELIDALQAQSGRQLPPEAGAPGTNVFMLPDAGRGGGKKKGGLPGLRER